MTAPIRLLLVRHAIAAERDARRWPDDGLRPLRRRGIEKFRRALPGIASLTAGVDLAWTSPLRRAGQSAGLGTRAGVWPEAQVTPLLAPGPPPATLGRALRALHTQDARPRTIALVGHEPGLSRFAAWCLGTSAASGLVLRKGGAMQLSFDGAVERGGARLDWLATPRMLRRLGRGVR